MLIFLCTGGNAALALLKLTQWMPMVVAFTSFLAGLGEFLLLPMRLAAVNGAILTLEDLLDWWESLSLVQRRLPEAKDYLVRTAEEAAAAEVAWAKRVGTRKRPHADEAAE